MDVPKLHLVAIVAVVLTDFINRCVSGGGFINVIEHMNVIEHFGLVAAVVTVIAFLTHGT